jgi:D-inositol-3-phosphate glycosyltransferase
MGCSAKPDILHANYWLSGIAGHWLKHELDIPLVMTFHTLDRVKALTYGEPSSERAADEERIMACSDAVLASCDIEAQQIVDFYDANPARVHIVPLGVEHAFFSPGNKMEARRALGMPTDEALLLFAGRIQDLKGVDLALEAFIEVRRRNGTGHLAIVGGPSGPNGRETLDRVQRRIAAGQGLRTRCGKRIAAPHVGAQQALRTALGQALAWGRQGGHGLKIL